MKKITSKRMNGNGPIFLTLMTLVIFLGAMIPAESCPRHVPTANQMWPDTVYREVILVPDEGGGSAMTAELLVIYRNPQDKWPSSMAVQLGQMVYPVPLSADGPQDEGLVEIGGKIYRFRRIRPYER
jgi:hypothetical protein